LIFRKRNKIFLIGAKVSEISKIKLTTEVHSPLTYQANRNRIYLNHIKNQNMILTRINRTPQSTKLQNSEISIH
jgi:hypothetical protein